MSLSRFLVSSAALLACAIGPAYSQPQSCQASYGLCLARDAAKLELNGGKLLLWGVTVTGAVGDIVLWTEDMGRKHPGFDLSKLEEYRKLSPQQTLAAATLAAAAFNSDDPYADGEWLAVAGAFRDDAAVAHHAVLAIRDIGYQSWQSVLRNPPGLVAIWRKIVARTPDDIDQLLDLAGDVSFYGPSTVKPLARQLVDRAMALPGRTPEQMATAASLLARKFHDADAAQALMDAGGYQAKDQVITDDGDLLVAAATEHAIENGGSAADVQVIVPAEIAAKEAEIAAARMWNGKGDAAGADLVAAQLMDETPIFANQLLDVLHRGGGTVQLRRVGDAWLARGRSAGGRVETAVQYFGAASDAYRIAGDTDKAIAAAREGMALIPLSFSGWRESSNAKNANDGIPDHAERRRLAGRDNGMHIAPAIALFRAGAETEALESSFTSGGQLLESWDKPLDAFDPQWIVDDTSKWLDSTISTVLSLHDPAFAGRVHDALAKAPDFAEPEQLAVLAAAAGNAEQVRGHIETLLASAKSPNNHPDDEPYIMANAVLTWKVGDMLLKALPAR